MQSRGRDWIGTAVTFRNDTVEASIYGNKADFNSYIDPYLQLPDIC